MRTLDLDYWKDDDIDTKESPRDKTNNEHYRLVKKLKNTPLGKMTFGELEQLLNDVDHHPSDYSNGIMRKILNRINRKKKKKA